MEQTLSQELAEQMLLCTHQPIVFSSHIIKQLDFSEKNLSGTFFAGVWMEDTNFKNTNCEATSFYGSILKNVDFSGSNLNNAIFDQAVITDCNFSGIKASIFKKIYLWFKNS